VGLEVVQVHVFAAVSLVRITWDSLDTAILALEDVLAGTLVAEAVPPLAVVVTSSTFLGPGRLSMLVS
jgi:hypothetical protein